MSVKRKRNGVLEQTISPSIKSKHVGSPLTFKDELAKTLIFIGSNLESNLSNEDSFSTI